MQKTTERILKLGADLAAGAAAVGALYAFYRHFLPPTRRKVSLARYPYALLLGCAAHDDGTPSTAQIGRTQLAVDEYENGLFDTLMISGGAVRNPYTEATMMKEMIQKHSDMPILTETHAKNTWENMAFAKDILGDVPIVIMTGSMHARRASAMAANFFTDYVVVSYPDFSWKRLKQEIPSRIQFIAIELSKFFKNRKNKPSKHATNIKTEEE